MAIRHGNALISRDHLNNCGFSSNTLANKQLHKKRDHNHTWIMFDVFEDTKSPLNIKHHVSVDVFVLDKNNAEIYFVYTFEKFNFKSPPPSSQ